MAIPFNKPHLTGKEVHYMYQAVFNGKLSGNGEYTKRCQAFFEQRYGFRKCLLTTSGTDALEMCAMLCDLKQGDEVIVPSYTFVSTALAILREGAKVVFADSMKRNPNLDAETLESLITPRTKVIVPVHYAGVACDMDAIMAVHSSVLSHRASQAQVVRLALPFFFVFRRILSGIYIVYCVGYHPTRCPVRAISMSASPTFVHFQRFYPVPLLLIASLRAHPCALFFVSFLIFLDE